MKFTIVLFLLFDVPHLKGQQRIEELEHILLRFSFPPYYNGYSKSCCKLYPGGCYKLLDSTGYTCDLLNGRVTQTENDGWIEFKISGVQFVDGGYYRCYVVGTQNQFYRDFYVEVSEVSGRHSQSPPSLTTTIKGPNSSTALPDSTRAVMAEEYSDSPRVSWSRGLLLAVIVSISGMILITSVIAVVCCRVQAKRKHTDKYGGTPRESLKPEAPDISSVVYTTVDFRAHQKPAEVYANLRMHEIPAGAPESDEMVEYSTLAIHQ